MQATINESDVMYRLLVQGVIDYAIYMLTPQGLVANWNPGAQRVKGYSHEQIIGQHFGCFYSPQDRLAGVPDMGLASARAEGRFETEGWRFRKDGSSFWAHVVIDAILDKHDELIGFAKITRDVSERREFEMQLIAAKEMAEATSDKLAALSTFLDSVITNIPSSVIVLNAASRQVRLANLQAERLFDCKRDDMIDRRVEDCLSAPVADYIHTLADHSARRRGVQLAEQAIETPLGSRTLRSKTLSIGAPEGGGDYVLLIAEDVTEEHAALAQIRHMALHDSLTGLPNRRLLRERLEDALRNAGATRSMSAVLCLDLDGFKNVNDAYGHQVGDKLLLGVAQRLREVLREHDTLARLGGDEFAIVLPVIKSTEMLTVFAQRLIDILEADFVVDKQILNIGVSVGIAVAPLDSDSADHLMRAADKALYEAKRNGRNRFELYRLELDEISRKRQVIETDLRIAIGKREFEMHYQPIVDPQQQRVTGYEALIRWHHPTLGMVMPLEFITVAEETGLIHELGELALAMACHDAAKWSGELSVAVNLSPMQFKNSNLATVVERILRDAGLSPERLELEITESVLLDHSENNIATLRTLKQLGVQIALDDFGTGYSSLSYLRSFPFDRIKIDKSFVQDMTQSREALAVVRAIIGIASSLQIQTTAEGVETDSQLQDLIGEGCSHFQGYYFGRPEPDDNRMHQL
jgi:diguanylate cyclase (GGDEF)-like protein/PAS domain S-box-containing protein